MSDKEVPIKILMLSDLHCGHITGLTPDEFASDITGATSRPMWKWFCDTNKEIGKVDILVANGDLVEGEGKAETIGHLTTDIKKQADIAATCLEIPRGKHRYLAYGTPFHTVGSTNYELMVADRLGCPIYDELLLKVGKWKFNIRHVSGRSDIPYGQGTPLYKEVIRDLIRAIDEERESADFIVRAHVHYYAKIEIKRKMAISLPCLQLPENVYGRKVKAMYYDIGMVLFTIMNDNVSITPYFLKFNMINKREYIVH